MWITSTLAVYSIWLAGVPSRLANRSASARLMATLALVTYLCIKIPLMSWLANPHYYQWNTNRILVFAALVCNISSYCKNIIKSWLATPKVGFIMPYFIGMLIPTKIAYFPLRWKVVSSGEPGKKLAAKSFQVFPYSLLPIRYFPAQHTN